MFLNKLTWKEKEAFISLAVKAAQANGVVTNEEHIMIEEYCKEMGISYADVALIETMDEIIKIYAESSEEHKRIIILETIGLMNADEEFDTKEKEFVFSLAESAGVAKGIVERMMELISRYLDLTKEIICTIEGENS